MDTVIALNFAVKPGSHYGEHLLGVHDRTTALRAARALVTNAQVRTT